MDNIPEQGEPKEPRRGIAPFAGGFETVDNTDLIQSKQFQLGGLGNARVLLRGPLISEKEGEYEEEDIAFTVDLSGKITRGNARDFMRKGYSAVRAIIDYGKLRPDYDWTENLRINIWLDNTKPIVSSDIGDKLSETEDLIFFTHDTGRRYRNSYGDIVPKLEYFMLQNNPEILQAIRVSLTNKRDDTNNVHKEFNYWERDS